MLSGSSPVCYLYIFFKLLTLGISGQCLERLLVMTRARVLPAPTGERPGLLLQPSQTQPSASHKECSGPTWLECHGAEAKKMHRLLNLCFYYDIKQEKTLT